MSESRTLVQAHKIHPLTRRIADSVATRASQVKTLIRERRKIVLTFRRTQDELKDAGYRAESFQPQRR